MTRWLASALIIVVAASCASAADAPVVERRQEVQEKPPPEPRYVVLSRLNRLHLQPDSDSAFVAFRSPAEQEEKLKEIERERVRLSERKAKRAERDAEREEKRAERVKKRARRLRGDRREAYLERQAERLADRERKRAEDSIEQQTKWANEHYGEANHEHLYVAQIVEERGDWVGVKPITDRAPRCYDGAANRLRRLDVVFWTQRSNLLDVVTTRTRVPVAHGTEVILAPGIAIREGRAFVDGFELGLSIPDDAVGRFYTAGRGFEAPYTETVFSPLAFANDWLRLEKDSPLPYNPWHPMHVTATLFVGDRFYATTQTPCAEYTVRTIEEALEPVGRRAAMRVGGDETREVSPPMVSAGAQIFGPSGGAIGTARADLPVIDEWEGRPEYRCWNYEVWDGDQGQRRIPICVKPEDFQSLNLTEGL